MCVGKGVREVSFFWGVRVGVENLRSFSQSAGLTTQLTAEGTSLLETVFTLTP